MFIGKTFILEIIDTRHRSNRFSARQSIFVAVKRRKTRDFRHATEISSERKMSIIRKNSYFVSVMIFGEDNWEINIISSPVCRKAALQKAGNLKKARSQKWGMGNLVPIDYLGTYLDTGKFCQTQTRKSNCCLKSDEFQFEPKYIFIGKALLIATGL